MSANVLSVARATEILTAARQTRLLVVGDVMLDQFIWGSVTRISPEAPVPVVEFKREPKSLRILVTDDGRGFDPALQRQAGPQKPSFGLIGIQERVKIMGGILEITSRPGEGTRLSAHIPLPLPSPPTPPR